VVALSNDVLVAVIALSDNVLVARLASHEAIIPPLRTSVSGLPRLGRFLLLSPACRLRLSRPVSDPASCCQA
jgi:hypothetical protein